MKISIQNFTGSVENRSAGSQTIRGLYTSGSYNKGVRRTITINKSNSAVEETFPKNDFTIKLMHGMPSSIWKDDYYKDNSYTFYGESEESSKERSAILSAIKDDFNNGTVFSSLSSKDSKNFSVALTYWDSSGTEQHYNSFPPYAQYSIEDTPTFENLESGYFQIQITFKYKGSNSKPQRSNTKARSASVYDEDYILSILTPSYYSDNNFVNVNNHYLRWRAAGEECASYYTEVPTLCRSRGYRVVLKDKNNKPYTGYVGVALINTYIENPDGGYNGRDYLSTSNRWHEFTTYSQSRYNEYLYTNASNVTSTYQYSYAGWFNHPASGRKFFSFEDWEITKPVGDPDINGIVDSSVSSYDDYIWGWGDGTEDLENDTRGTGDYSSDRDYNDLIFRITPALLMADPEPSTEIKVSDESLSWLWALEDLGSTDDFDFNDVVIRITSVTTNVTTLTTTPSDEEGGESTTTSSSQITKKVQFTPLAAGGTLPIYIHYVGDGGTDYVLEPGIFNLIEGQVPSGKEFHKWFDASASSSQMINTGNGTTSIDIDVDAMSCTLIIGMGTTTEGTKGFSIAWNDISITNANIAVDAAKQGSLYVTVNTDQSITSLVKRGDAIDKNKTEGYAITESYKGGAPQSFILVETSDSEWAWPTERTHITIPYEEFAKWISNKTGNEDWYKNPHKDRQTCIYHRNIKP